MEDEYHILDRIDSVDGKVYQYYENSNLPESEYVIADLLGEVGDTIITFSPTFPGWPSNLIVTSIDTFYKWGLTKVRKNFAQTTYLAYSHFSYTEDIGMDYWGGGINGTSSYFEIKLKGCVINGIVYGDTTLTGIDDEENPIASEFKLEQNFPNPFNPSTKIKFTIPNVIASGAKQSQLITLKVYDILGNEIATLVNEELSAGEYEVEFNSSAIEHHPSSGIYFYQLKAGEFIQTKKMILLK
jgi:Secretion system C-terminal sorting domain